MSDGFINGFGSEMPRIREMTTGNGDFTVLPNLTFNSETFAELLKKFVKPTAEQQKAQEELNNKKASNGLTYIDAQTTMKEITHKYELLGGENNWLEGKTNPYMMKVDNSRDSGTLLYMFHYEIDPDKLPPEDRKAYLKAKAAVEEIERNNSALLEETRPKFNINLKS